MDFVLPWAFIGPQEMTLVLIGVLVLFGAKKVPELARGLGEGMKEFKKAVREVGDDGESAQATPAATTATAAPADKATPAESAEDVEKRIVH